MDWSNARCPVCGNGVYVPTDREKHRCPSCGNEILTKAAVAFAKSNPRENSASQFKSASQLAKPRSMPFLTQWKTSVGMFVLGLLCSYALSFVAFLGTYALIIVMASFVLGMFYWILVAYPSLFTDSPRIKRTKSASFFNAFFGGILFGALWNSCLTKKRRGISHYVFLALAIISFAAAIGVFCYNQFGPNPYNQTDSLYSRPEHVVTTPEAKQIAMSTQYWKTDAQKKSPFSGITFGELSENGKTWSIKTVNSREAVLELERLALAQVFGGEKNAREAFKGSIELPSEEKQLRALGSLGGASNTIAISGNTYRINGETTMSSRVSYSVTGTYYQDAKPQYYCIYFDILRA